jgi:hypothetical protein
VKSFAALSEVVAFFEERRGRLYGFRFRDRLGLDLRRRRRPIQPTRSAALAPVMASARLSRCSSAMVGPARPMTGRLPSRSKQRCASRLAAPNRTRGVDFDVNPATGLVSFRPGHIPGVGATVTAGFAFDVPVRFDTDFLDINLEAFEAGAIPKIPLIEILL